MRQKRAIAHSTCKPLYDDIYMPPGLKLKMFKCKEEAADKYGIETVNLSPDVVDKINKTQMSNLKETFKIHSISHNTILRLMTNVRTYDDERVKRTIKVSKEMCRYG